MFCIRFPGCMTDGVILLRRMKISDGPYLRKQLAGTEALSYSELNRPVSASWFHVWLKIRKIFNLAYLIVVDARPVGFIGLCSLVAGQSAEMSLVIFDREQRRQGFGRRAFHLVANNLQTYFTVKRIFVRYKIDNADARSFWSACGFQEECRQDTVITMSRDYNKLDVPR